MVDAADEAKFAEAKEELHQLMAKPQLANIPLLVLGNKNDLPEAVKDEETLKQLLYVVLVCNFANPDSPLFAHPTEATSFHFPVELFASQSLNSMLTPR